MAAFLRKALGAGPWTVLDVAGEGGAGEENTRSVPLTGGPILHGIKQESGAADAEKDSRTGANEGGALNLREESDAQPEMSAHPSPQALPTEQSPHSIPNAENPQKSPRAQQDLPCVNGTQGPCSGTALIPSEGVPVLVLDCPAELASDYALHQVHRGRYYLRRQKELPLALRAPGAPLGCTAGVLPQADAPACSSTPQEKGGDLHGADLEGPCEGSEECGEGREESGVGAAVREKESGGGLPKEEEGNVERRGRMKRKRKRKGAVPSAADSLDTTPGLGAQRRCTQAEGVPLANSAAEERHLVRG